MTERRSQPEFPLFAALAVLYFCSGIVGLGYEVLWVRMLSLQFGVSIFAVVLTVAAFMVGLGAGSLFAVRRLANLARPLRWFALLEGGVALYSLLLPLLMKALGGGVEAAASLPLFQWYVLIGIAAMGLLLLPAFAMGAGFPLLIAALGNDSTKFGRIYGLNTLGAALGALLPLWLLPQFGWGMAIRIEAALGLAVAVAAYLVSQRTADRQDGAVRRVARPPLRMLALYAAVGAASLMLEVGWTRLFGMVMLRTEYVLALILAAFLLGIALGSLLAPRKHRDGWFLLLPVLAGGSAMAGLWLLPVLSAWVERSEYTSLFGAMALQGLALVLLTLPTTLVLGAWMPLLDRRSGGGGVWLYGANSLGGALGALLAGLLFIPLLGSTVTVLVAALALTAAGLAWSGRALGWLALPLLLAAGWPVARMPDVSRLLPQAQAGSHNLSIYEDAVSMTHVVEQASGQRLLLTDLQRMDASTDPTAVFVQSNQARLPLLLHGSARKVLFLGLGTGISVTGSLPFPDLQRTAVELSQGSIQAAGSWFAPVNRGALAHTQVRHDDVRHFLSATDERYDVIVGDVFHPDLAGVSSLLSVQQFSRARARLAEGGIFVQWLAINQFDRDSLQVILRSFRQAFPAGQMFLDGMHLALVGPRDGFGGAAGMLANLRRLPPAAQVEETAGEGGWSWLGRYWGPVPHSGGKVQDEWSPVIEFSLPRARYAGEVNLAANLEMLLAMRPRMAEAERELGLTEGDPQGFERAYAGSELLVRSWLAAMRGAASQSGHLMRLAFQANPTDRWITLAYADTMLDSLPQARARGIGERDALLQILSINPRHVESLRALWHLQLKDADPEAETTRSRLLENSPLDREALNWKRPSP
jgi:spermidine synthase